MRYREPSLPYLRPNSAHYPFNIDGEGLLTVSGKDERKALYRPARFPLGHPRSLPVISLGMLPARHDKPSRD
jgi:hypothetical protein